MQSLQTNEVVITCTNWRNPVYPGIIPGFFIRTYDHHMDLDEVIDTSESLSLDASALSPVQHSTQFKTSNPYTRQVTSLTFEFETAVSV